MHSAAELKITGFEIEGESLRITFEDPDGLNNPLGNNQFALQKATGLNLDSWEGLPVATFVPINGTTFQFTVPKSEADREFFRIIGSFFSTALDPDGDGLPEAIETTLGTRTDRFDSDGDGFSDGVEYGYGTDPLSAASKPEFVDLPTVNFVRANSTAAEGSGPHQIEIVFDRPYSGVVNYAVNPLGNTAAGTDFTLDGASAATTGSISMSGTSAFISISPVDDAIVSGQRAAIIDIKLNGEKYFLGGRFTHIVLLEDNDAWWTGSFIPASGENDGRTLRLKISSTATDTTATFGAGAGLDGLPIPEVEAAVGTPDIATTSNSSSVIPDGQWVAVVNAASASHFSVETPELTVPAGSLFPTEQLRRKVILNAQLSLNGPGRPHIIDKVRYIGDYVETLTSGTGAPLATFPGSFIMVRDIPTPLPVLSELVPDTP